MNKKIFILLAVFLIILFLGGLAYYNFFVLPNKKDSYGCLINKGYSWCDFKNKCVKENEEDCVLRPEWILNEAKKIIGLDLNIMPNEPIKWNTKDGETAFSTKGIYYTDLLKAEKVMKGFDDWDKFLNKIGLKNDSYNPAISSEKESITKYIKEKIICVLKRTDNPNNTSSLGLFCGNIDERLCNFNSDCGKECKTDNDCDLLTNGCERKIVCRNKNYKFYNDCLNPTAKVSELDVSINNCICLGNQCVPENEKLRFKN